METMMAAGFVLSPLGLIIFFLVPAFTIFATKRPYLTAGRLISGYAGSLFALAIVVAASSYVSPQEAVSVWHVPPSRYWAALIELIFGTFVVDAFASIIGISFVGVPTLIFLARHGMATAPWLILASVFLSAVAAVLAFAVLYSSTDITFVGILWRLVGTHAALAVGFALAARLPWTMSTREHGGQDLR